MTVLRLLKRVLSSVGRSQSFFRAEEMNQFPGKRTRSLSVHLMTGESALSNLSELPPREAVIAWLALDPGDTRRRCVLVYVRGRNGRLEFLVGFP